MAIEVVVYQVEAMVREGRKHPVTRTQDGDGLTLKEAHALAKAMLADLEAEYPGWTQAEMSIHYNLFFVL